MRTHARGFLATLSIVCTILIPIIILVLVFLLGDKSSGMSLVFADKDKKMVTCVKNNTGYFKPVSFECSPK